MLDTAREIRDSATRNLSRHFFSCKLIGIKYISRDPYKRLKYLDTMLKQTEKTSAFYPIGVCAKVINE